MRPTSIDHGLKLTQSSLCQNMRKRCSRQSAEAKGSIWNGCGMILKPRMILQPKPGDSETKTDDSETKNDSETKKMIPKPRMTPKPRTPGNQKWHGSAIERCAFLFFGSIELTSRTSFLSTSMFLPIRMAWQRLITRMLASRVRASHVTEVERGKNL